MLFLILSSLVALAVAPADGTRGGGESLMGQASLMIASCSSYVFQGALTLFLILTGIVAFAVAIAQPRADSQESRPSAMMLAHVRLRGLSIPVLIALLH